VRKKLNHWLVSLLSFSQLHCQIQAHTRNVGIFLKCRKFEIPPKMRNKQTEKATILVYSQCPPSPTGQQFAHCLAGTLNSSRRQSFCVGVDENDITRSYCCDKKHRLLVFLHHLPIGIATTTQMRIRMHMGGETNTVDYSALEAVLQVAYSTMHACFS
jgi:hypothetical protein